MFKLPLPTRICVILIFLSLAVFCPQANAFPVFHPVFENGEIETDDLSEVELGNLEVAFTFAANIPQFSDNFRREAGVLSGQFESARSIKLEASQNGTKRPQPK